MSQMLANGIRLNYETFGNPENPAFILIRGLGTQMIEWHVDLLKSLQELGLHVVIFDNRDVGLSEKIAGRLPPGTEPGFAQVVKGEAVGPYRLSDMAADVCGLMDGLDIEKAHIMGVSLGGMITQIMAAEFPDRVASMISVMSSSGRPGLPGPNEEAQVAFAEPAPENIDDAVEQMVRHKVVFGSPGYPESLEVRTKDSTRAIARCYYPSGIARQRLAAASQLDRTALLATIALPATVIHGTDDSLIPLACGEDTASLIPGAHFEAVKGMGHNIPGSLVPEYVALVAAHLTRAGVSL